MGWGAPQEKLAQVSWRAHSVYLVVPTPADSPKVPPCLLQTQRDKHRCFGGALGRAWVYSKSPDGVCLARTQLIGGGTTWGPSLALSREADAGCHRVPASAAGLGPGQGSGLPQDSCWCVPISQTPSGARLAGQRNDQYVVGSGD